LLARVLFGPRPFGSCKSSDKGASPRRYGGFVELVSGAIESALLKKYEKQIVQFSGIPALRSPGINVASTNSRNFGAPVLMPARMLAML
jgi:hypothetical protein